MDPLKKDIDQYISGFPQVVQTLLQQVREAIKRTAPDAEETISYAIPCFKLQGRYLVYFAAYKNHIGFYPAPVGIAAFKKEFSAYKTGKGTVQFPFDQPMPLDLVSRIVRYRVKENAEFLQKKKALRTCKKGHKYYKSSDCPTCPICEEERKPKDSFLSLLAAPARRALENKGIDALEKLSGFTEKEILALHGMGKSSLPKLRKAMAEKGLDFKA